MKAEDDPVVLRRALDQLAGLLEWCVARGLTGRPRLPRPVLTPPPSSARMQMIFFAPCATTRPGSTGGPRLAVRRIRRHTWDLAAFSGRSTGDLDVEVAERGLAFMRANLTETNHSPAFGPEQPAPEGADGYQRVAAFSGRSV
jgi:hypothetical protein